MRAEARLVAEPDGRGGTRLSTVYGEPPLLPRRTNPHHRAAEVHFVGGAAGPLGGDDLRVAITVRTGAHLVVRTIAAALAQPSDPRMPSRLDVVATVEAGAALDWLPEPTIAAIGCDHHQRSIVDLADGARLTWREEIVAGRHAEPAGDLRTSTAVRCAGRTILRHDLGIGPHAQGWDGPAIAGAARAVGTLLLVGPGAPTKPAVSGTAALMPLARGPAALITAAAQDARALRTALTATTWADDPDAELDICRES
ncbi:urease accessory protein UreD [Asanoa sp. WMMD1127]|uniref:urease accessory protein UreD n=1 Tax=Asanoa sp. WMMD1127 TaxID=3016107 RepID=UPI0024163C21|nr:urease accessory protein UreD [Asanoa sp. WMMD1127]MDG4824419.1 urease accessory protein UreD [Asanoa sp. WMMD1127]